MDVDVELLLVVPEPKRKNPSHYCAACKLSTLCKGMTDCVTISRPEGQSIRVFGRLESLASFPEAQSVGH